MNLEKILQSKFTPEETSRKFAEKLGSRADRTLEFTTFAYSMHFSPAQIRSLIKNNHIDADIKHDLLDCIASLAGRFAGLLPGQLWVAIASGLEINQPLKKPIMVITDIAGTTPGHELETDLLLHAFFAVPELSKICDAEFSKTARVVLTHCDECCKIWAGGDVRYNPVASDEKIAQDYLNRLLELGPVMLDDKLSLALASPRVQHQLAFA